MSSSTRFNPEQILRQNRIGWQHESLKTIRKR
jgi:hypothetical protein